MKKIIVAETILGELEKNSFFKRSNIEFFVAHSSEEIHNIHRSKKVDLIVADDALPRMGGARLCSLIRNDNELKDVSIILVCNDAEPYRSQCKNAEANVLLPKPVDPAALLWKASELLVVQQRKDIRAKLRVDIQGMGKNSSFFAETLNISISGLQIETDQELRENERLECTFKIAHNDLTVPASVRRMDKTASGKFRYGVKFINCDTKTLIIIEHYVKSQLKR